MAYSSETSHNTDFVTQNFGGTTYFFSSQTDTMVESNLTEESAAAAAASSSSEPAITDLKHTYPGPTSHVAKIQPTNPLFTSFLTITEVKQQILKRNEITNTLPPTTETGLPSDVDTYHSLVPLETNPVVQKIPQIASTYKATNSADGMKYCLRRLHGCRLQSTKCMQIVEKWKKLQCSNIVKLREVFTTKAFGDNSLIVVYDYMAGAETLLSRYFRNPETGAMNFSDRFSNRPPNSKNLLPENELWWIIMQLTAAVRVIHTNGLACRNLDPTKVIFTGKRIRLSFLGISDIILFDPNESHHIVTHHQQEDLTSLGKLVLALACKSLQGIQRERIQSSIEMISRMYSADLRHLVLYLLSTNERSISECMPMIGARFYVQIDALQTQTDILEDELSKELENGRLYRLLVKLGSINERPGLMDISW